MGVAFTLAFLSIAVAVLAVLGGCFLMGLILLIVYLVQRNQKKKRGEKASKVPLIVSIVFFVPPAGALIVFLISLISNNIERMSWNNFRDEWINSSYVTDSGAKYDAVEAFFEAADAGDKDAIKLMFTENIQASSALDKQIEEFLAVYPGGFSGNKPTSWGGSSSGMDPAYINQSAEIEVNGELYHISLGACYQDSENPKNVGIEYIYIKSEEAYAYEYDTDYSVNSDRTFIRGNFQEYDSFDARKIGVHTYAYKETDRELTKAEIEEAVESSRTFDDLIGKIGEPNADCIRLGWAAYGLSEGEGYAYAVVSYDERYDRRGQIYDVSYYEEENEK